MGARAALDVNSIIADLEDVLSETVKPTSSTIWVRV